MVLLFDGTRRQRQPKQRLPAHTRASHPPKMILTRRDVDILHAIHHYDGILSVDQIHRWFFGVKRHAQQRISKLYHNRYLQKPSRQEQYRVPEPVVRLDTRGAHQIAAHHDMAFKDFHWQNTFRWRRVAHDIGLNEFRHSLELAIQQQPVVGLDKTYGQNHLRQMLSSPVDFLDVQGQQQSKHVWPDAYYALTIRREAHAPTSRLLVEYDNNTTDNTRFGRDKVSPGIHLILSALYRQQLGGNTGRFLVPTTVSDMRFENLRKSITQAGGARYFLLAKAHILTPANILTEAVWHLPHLDQPVSLLDYLRPDYDRWLKETTRQCPAVQVLSTG